ncbi:hypothetical protein PCANC_08998 [Puccinia coronata f. sp. avenae]|uniref:Uncharacterized protein n=1 Tax=Puccinia coronata f. sp. avenae TaxID=200324 RepID=A0A2N5VHQ1_9BASI|nr:hypothetical protein PCANC_08998 [Puccinia coronata f. sp. avenae]
MISSPDAGRTSAVAVDHTRTRTVVQHERYNRSRSQTESNNESDSVTLGSTDTIKTESDSGSDFPAESDVKGDDKSDSVTLGSTNTIEIASGSGSDFPVESDVEGGLVTLGSKDTIDTDKEEVAESSMEVINKPNKDASIEESNDSMTVVGVEDMEEYELVASYEEQPINEEEVNELDSEFEIDVKNEVANS